jgi:signal transduction histidine kinase
VRRDRMPDPEGYSPRNRAERVISAGRLFLAGFLTLAILAELQEPREHAEVIIILAFGYFAYSLGIAILTWTRRLTTRGVAVATHVIDLVLFSVFMYLTDGARSPLFPYFVFAIICGAVRWFGKGALWTGFAAIVAYVWATLSGLGPGAVGHLNTAEFIARTTQLALVSALLGYLGAYQHRLQREITSLAAWPRRLPTEGTEALQEVLAYAAGVLNTPRLVLLWEEVDEPSLRVAIRDGETFEMRHERPDAFGSVVAEPLQRSSFIATRLRTRRRRVLQRVPGGFRFWSGEPLDGSFRERYNVKSVIALRLSTDSIQGWLFALDRGRATADDLLLGDIVGRLIAGALELQTLIEQLRESAAGEERVHLARELHDGVLQSLTAASLQAQRARQAIASSPADAERRMAMVEETILAEQQALRLAIEDLKPGAMRETAAVDVIPRIRETATRVGRQWDVRVHLNLLPGACPMPQKTAHELTRMVQEALVNAIRHGGAREITVTCVTVATDLTLAVSYQGRGFAGFHGRHDLASLNVMRVGPRTLKERVSAVNGSLVIESGESGARVEIRVPLTAPR